MNQTIMIIPDIHGRTFWKEAVNNSKYGRIIFLGDYLDVYPREGIDLSDAVKNFEEIIGFARNNVNVTLLIGNHDCSYIYDKRICLCRTDYGNFEHIAKLFKDNIDLFKFATIEKIGNTNILFSHAGLHKSWTNKVFLNADDLDEIVSNLNSKVVNADEHFISHLADASYIRGGYSKYGSIVWADLREWSFENEYDICQIVGHTQLVKDEPVLLNNEKFICIDCRHAFEINSDNRLTMI